MNFRQFVQDYLTFNRNERKGITLLLVIIFLLAVANKMIFYFESPATIDTEFLETSLANTNSLINDSLRLPDRQNKLFSFNPNTISGASLDSLLLPEAIKRNILKYRGKGGKYYSENDFRKMYGVNDSIFLAIQPFLVFENKKVQPTRVTIQSELFSFDPNLASDQDFQRLGLGEKQIQILRNYQRKGGNFRSQADFLKIYSLTPSQKEKLAPYVTIAKKGVGEVKAMEKAEEKEQEKMDLMEINSVDSIELKMLPGIGNKLSKRIVRYRDLLGGYCSVAQLKEVYGLSEQTIDQIEGYFLVDSTKIQKIDLNFADWNELAKHPYLQKKLASQIVKFRTRYGSINDPAVLRDSLILSPKEYDRLRPYW